MLGYDTSRVNYFQDSELIERPACTVDASNSPHKYINSCSPQLQYDPTEFLWWRRYDGRHTWARINPRRAVRNCLSERPRR